MDDTYGKTLFFSDISANYGVGGNINYSDVKCIRLMCSTYLGTQFPTSIASPDEFEQWVQYIKTDINTQVYDNKSVGLADLFLPFIAGISVQYPGTFDTTGVVSKYISPAQYLPASNHNILNLDTSYWGIPEEIFPNLVYGLQYEIYQDTTPNPLTTVTDQKQYIVYGTTGTATWNGNTYRIGEVFIASNNGAVTFTGDATIKILSASKNKYYVFIWGLEKRLWELFLANNCGCDAQFAANIDMINLEMQGLDWTNLNNWVSATKATDTINWINDRLTILENEDISAN